MKNKFLKNMNMALIGLTAISLAQTAFAQTEVMDLKEDLNDSIRVSKSMFTPAAEKNADVSNMFIEEDEDEDDFVLFDANNTPTTQDLRNIVISYHSYGGKQNFSNSYEPLIKGKDSLLKAITNTGPLVKNIRNNVDRADEIGNSVKKIVPVTCVAVYELATFQESWEGFTTRVFEPINKTKACGEEIMNDLPEIKSNITNVSYDMYNGIKNLGRATYSAGLGTYHYGHVGAQKVQAAVESATGVAQAAYNSFSNWWNGK